MGNINTVENNELLVEAENGNENVKNVMPFKPKDININIVPRTIGQIVEMLEYNEIIIPKFQRRPDLWNIKKKSRFIESLMLNLPIPLFYFDEGEDKKWRVIDGLQRVSTLEHFILSAKEKNNVSENSQPFKLVDLEFLKECNDKTWSDLPREIQRGILTNQVTINLIGKGTPEEVKYNIYSRINQGGVELKPQEIRTALFQGYRMDLLEGLVSPETDQGKAFLKSTGNSIPSKRQEDLDFVTRFVSFYLVDYKQYEPDMDTFMTTGTTAIPSDKRELKKITSNFKSAMNLAFEIFGADSFRKPRRNPNQRMPINKPLFEVISVYFAKLSDDEKNKILSRKSRFQKEFTNLLNKENFFTSITSGTAKKDGVKTRHSEFETLIEQFKK